jgi:hypothetical protein
MYPHERSLVTKYQDRPFVLIGVNSDSNRAQLKKIVAREKLAWRSFWDGGSTQVPIASRWNVSGWPTVYLIDHRGVIVRQIGLSKADDELIEESVRQAEAASVQPPGGKPPR